jgi:indolepyruvate ferredoxin oxidoreductase beta subunit
MNSQNSRVINVVLAGVGGQGILLASEILARTAMLAGYMVKTNEVHGMAQRGGSVIAQIRYGAKVFSPLVAVGTADVLAALEKIEALRYAHYLSPSGFAVVSSDEMVPITVSSGNAIYPKEAETLLKQAFPRVACIDAAGEAVGLGAAQAANTVVMGAVSTELSLPVEFWQESIRATVKPKYVDINLKAFDAGRRLILEKKK